MAADDRVWAEPSQDMMTSGKIDTRPGKVEEWIAALPLADTRESARRIFHALRDLNQAPLNDRHHFQIMELFREPVLYICSALQKHFVSHEFPLPPRQQKISALEREIQMATANGYKIIANNLVDIDTGHNTPLAASAIHRALRYLGRVLLNGYKTYSGAPEHVWKEIHQLYHYAELQNLHLVPVTDIENWFAARTNVVDIYKQILLLAMADPFHLKPEETEKVYIVLSAWTSHCRLSSINETAATGMFGVNLEDDEQPLPVTAAQAQMSGTWRILDIVGLTQTLRSLHESPHTLVRIVPGDARTAMSKDLLQHLMFSWGITPKRRSRRLDSSTKVIVTLGLSSTHYFATTTTAFFGAHQPRETLDLLAATRHSLFERCSVRPDRDAAKKKLPEFTSRSEFSGRAVEGLQVTERRVLSMKDFLNIENYDGAVPDIESIDEVAATPLFDSFECTTINESNEGTRLRWACLSWEGTNSPRMRVGELVSIRGLGGNGSLWIIGIIRWMKKTANAAFEFGIQFLSPAADAVAVRIKDDRTGQLGDYQRALLLPEIPAIDRPATLVMPALVFRKGMAALLNVGGFELEIILAAPLHSSQFFGQFHFTVIDGIDRQDKAQASKEIQSRDMDSIWDII